MKAEGGEAAAASSARTLSVQLSVLICNSIKFT